MSTGGILYAAPKTRGKVRGALPRIPARGTPPETPAPFPSASIVPEGRESLKGSLRRPKTPPLTDSLPSGKPTQPNMRERGLWSDAR